MKKKFTATALAIALYCAAMLAIAAEATAATAHTGLAWQGSQPCLMCHEAEARAIHGSSHYQWQGPATYTVNGPDIQGKLSTALNSYCISILGNWNACGSCHIGLGAKPETTATVAQLQNVDCLICHQKEYKRAKVNGVFVPDTANMAVTMDQALATVHLPERSNCLQCHAKGGGGDNNKRGDMSLAHVATADRTFDVHLSTTGANLSCQQCHTTQDHRIAGRGSDLRQTDLDVKMTCSTAACHPTKATSTGHATADVNRHIGRVACQTCHIPTYARNAADTAATESTEVYRNWLTPEWNAALGRWEPAITRGGNLKPAYTFWNGFSWNYSLKDTVWLDALTGAYGTSRPEGGINEPGSKLYPFKYKKARQPLANGPGMLIALDTAVYFSTGNYDAAVKAGLVNMGYPGTTPYSDVETDTYQLITHEVMPKENALTCSQCHTATATQMNLKGMGYALKGTQAAICTQCHEQESMPSYTSVHSRHVTSRGYDCSWCHSFSRPERGLKMPPGSGTPPPGPGTPPPVPDTTPPSVTAFAIPATATSLTVAITALSATDNVAVAGYLVTETPARPSAGSTGWSSAKPASFTFTAAGAKTLYAWAKDAAGNVSTSLSTAVTVTVSEGVPDIATPNLLDFGEVKVRNSVRKSITVTNRGKAKLSVTRVEVVGNAAAVFKAGTASFTVNPSGEYRLQIAFSPTDRRSYSAALRIYSNDPDSPVTQVALKGSGGQQGDEHEGEDD